MQTSVAISCCARSKNRVPEKWEPILKWKRTASVLFVWNREIVSFEGTFEVYLCTSKGRLAVCYRHTLIMREWWEPQHWCCEQGRGVYTKRDWQMAPIKTVVGKNSNCVPEGRFGCFACSMWSYVSTWRATVDDGRSTMQTSFQCAIADKKGFISSDRGGGGLSNALSVQPTTWDASPVGGGLLP